MRPPGLCGWDPGDVDHFMLLYFVAPKGPAHRAREGFCVRGFTESFRSDVDDHVLESDKWVKIGKKKNGHMGYEQLGHGQMGHHWKFRPHLWKSNNGL